MILIYGTKTRSKIIGKPLCLKCSHCNNASFYEFVRDTRWFTLFYIPLIPFSRKYYLKCPTCSYGFHIKSGDTINSLEDFCKIATQHQTGQISADTFIKLQKEFCKKCNLFQRKDKE